MIHNHKGPIILRTTHMGVSEKRGLLGIRVLALRADYGGPFEL